MRERNSHRNHFFFCWFVCVGLLFCFIDIQEIQEITFGWLLNDRNAVRERRAESERERIKKDGKHNTPNDVDTTEVVCSNPTELLHSRTCIC